MSLDGIIACANQAKLQKRPHENTIISCLHLCTHISVAGCNICKQTWMVKKLKKQANIQDGKEKYEQILIHHINKNTWKFAE